MGSNDRVQAKRLGRIAALAKQYIGDEETVDLWLKQPNRALSGRTPLECVNSKDWMRAVENVLGLIAYGGVS